MADDLSIAGRLVALDEVTIESATKLVPRDKVGWGAPGAYTDVQDTDGNRLPVDSPTLAALLAPSTPANIPGASGAITSSTDVLMGVSARETSGTATAFFRLRAGSVTGTILATITLAANESIRDWYGPSGIAATGGVYYELVSGAVAGGVQTR